MKQTTKFLRILMCMVLGLSLSLHSCKDYDDDIDDLNNRVDGVITDLNALKETVNGLVKSVTYDKQTGILTVTPVTGNPVTYSLGQDIPEYVLKTEGTSCWLEKDGKQAGDKMTITMPTLPEEFDANNFTVKEEGGKYYVYYGTVKAFEIPQQDIPAGFDPSKMTVKEGVVYYGDTKLFDIPVGEKFDASLLTVKEGVVYYGEVPTSVTLPAVEKTSITKVGNEVTIKVGDQDEISFTVAAEGAMLKSLVYKPALYVDGIPAIEFTSFNFIEQNYTGLNSKNEAWANKANATATYINPAIEASYHVNPISADLTNYVYSFSCLDKRFVKTRSSEAGFSAAATFKSYNEGLLTVSVAIEGDIKTQQDSISVVALQAKQKATEENPQTHTVTSDYATLYKNVIENMIIAMPKTKATDPDRHYRTMINKANEAGAYNTVAIWDGREKVSCDTVLVYNSELDLNKCVEVHVCNDKGIEQKVDLEKFGMSLKFEPVKNYVIGTPATDQEKFVIKSEENVLTATVFGNPEAGLRAAIGRTPIIRVKLMNGSKVVKVAYIKVYIADADETPAEWNKTIEIDMPLVEFACGKNYKQQISVETMNTLVYGNKKVFGEKGIEKKLFHTTYTDFEDIKAKGDLGISTDIVVNDAEGTHVVDWALTVEEIWANAGKDVQNTVVFRNAAKTDSVVLVLKAHIDEILKSYDVVKLANIEPAYWENSVFGTAKYNVAVPDKGEKDSKLCIFKNNLNNPFKLKADSTLNLKNISNVEYFFSAEMYKQPITIDGIKVTFTIVGGTTLKGSATIDGVTYTDNVIATIDNNIAGEDKTDIIDIDETSDLAKILLNRQLNSLKVYIGAKGYLCGDENQEVALTFNGQNYYTASFYRPVNVKEEAGGEFIENVDYGDKGSYVDLADLVQLIDWRGRLFNDYTNYYDYYAISEIKVDLKNITSTFSDPNGVKYEALIPQLEVKTTQDKMGGQAPKRGFGFLTYHNNRGAVEYDFYLKVPVTIVYKWGEVVSQPITIKVNKTIVDKQ